MAKQAPVTKSNTVQSATRARSWERSKARKIARKEHTKLREETNKRFREGNCPTIWQVMKLVRFQSADRMAKRAKWL